MARILETLLAAVIGRPKSALTVLLLVTFGFVAAASLNDVEVDITQLGREDSATVQTMARVQQEFDDPSAVVQVIVDAGPGGDILTSEGLAAVSEVQRHVADALGEDLREPTDGGPSLLSLPVLLGLDERTPTEDDAQDARERLRAVAAQPQAAALISGDYDADAGSARATVIVAFLREGLSEQDRTQAALRVQEAVAETPEQQIIVYSQGLFVEGMLDAVRGEAPALFLVALLAVLVLLAVTFRSALVVGVGLVGLAMTVVWTFGLAGLLGPQGLGWIGPLSQLAIIVPILLVGLGIDFAVHLMARFRELSAQGAAPSPAASGAVRAVGPALAIAAVTTGVGFGATATAPLPLLATFGVQVALGILCAFLVMIILVPATQALWGRRLAAASARRRRRDSGAQPTGRESARPSSGVLTRAAVRTADRRPLAGLVVALMLIGMAVLASVRLDTQFDRSDFLPEGSDIEATLAHQEELFGSQIIEATFVLIDPPETRADLGSALDRASQQVAEVEGVRVSGGEAQIMARQAAESDTLLWQIRTTAGDGGAEQLAEDLAAALDPVTQQGAEVSISSEPMVVAEMNRDLAEFQVRSILLTLSIVTVLLMATYRLWRRRAVLGVIAMIPAVTSAAGVIAMMWVLGIDLNVLSATLTAMAIGIGVPYGVHVVNRFLQELPMSTPEGAVSSTVGTTGAALTGSAVTTLGALLVLSWSALVPIQTLGRLGAVAIVVALVAGVFVTPGALVLWARRAGRGES
ncbi:MULTISPECIES: efflux RND transporter permease subunit [Actinomycetes]|uniref:SSD domain-containing protein n=2 Tax=Actinomycetes TaxID=1760 RepID=A0ABP6LVL3_9MICC